MPEDANNLDIPGGMRAFEPPPEGFDPHTAPQEVLRRHGLPRRPDPDREPALARLWKRALVRPPTFIKAELAVDELMSSRGPQRRRRPAVEGPSGWTWEDTWAGTTRELNLNPSYAVPATCALTVLQVPHAENVTPGQTVAIGCWVGIDSGSDILQAGITAEVDPPDFLGLGGGVKYYAWTEWWQDNARNVKNFPVSAGEEVLIQVSVDQPNLGYAYFHNLSTGLATSVPIPAPSGVTASGGTVEWIVEVVTEYLPLFNSVLFENCWAGAANEIFGLEPGGVDCEITGYPGPSQFYPPPGQVFTETIVANQSSTQLVAQLGTNWS